jgi:SAM-dependent methyltransferase
MDLKAICPICRGESFHEMPVAEWGEMRRCVSCDLIFADPMTLPETPESLYNKAYQGISENPSMKEYKKRILRKQEIINGNLKPENRFLHGAFEEAQKWIKKNVPRGSVILDIGCGLAGWLLTIREMGFLPVGLDVAEEVVKIRAKEGFEVWHGTIDSIEFNWKNPAICTCFFVLQHISDPVGFLSTIRTKFPQATLIIGVWNKFTMPKVFSAASLPPRTLSWWSPKSLQQALEKAGYRISLSSGPIASGEFVAPKIFCSLISRDRCPGLYLKLLSIYHTLKPVLFFPLKLYMRLFHKNRAKSILAIAKPYSSSAADKPG